MDQSEYVKKILDLRKDRKLHSFVEERIIKLLNKITPELHPFKEIQGLAGGRNDLLLYEYNGRKVLFEIFASKSQVSRDLRILDNTKADVKIAIIIDKEVDKKVFEQFIRENPENNYPFIFIREFFDRDLIQKTVLELFKLIRSEDQHVLNEILNGAYSFKKFKELCNDEGLELLDEYDIKNKDVTFEKLFNYFILAKLIKLTKNYHSLEKIVKWLSNENVIKYTLFQLQHGTNLFLYTDLNENFALYTDIDLVDFLRIGPELDSPYILLSINSIINSILELRTDINEKIEIQIVVGNSFAIKSEDNYEVTLSIPKYTNSITIFRPHGDDRNLSNEDIIKMIKIV